MAYATVDELAAALRIAATAANTAALQACLDAAATEIDHTVSAPAAEWGAADWNWTTLTTATDPGAGNVGIDNTNPVNATTVRLDPLDRAGTDWTGTLTTLAVNDHAKLEEPATGRYHAYRLTGAPTNMTGWIRLAVEYVQSSAPPPQYSAGEQLRVTFVRPAGPVGDPLANRVNILRGVEWWKANDAAFGVIGFDDTGALQAPRNGFRRHAAALIPLKQQWGVG